MSFRRWVHEMWLENRDELYSLQIKPYNQAEYFNKYKFWLKREYKHQMGK